MPALVVNTNVPSINGQRNLYDSTRSLTQSLERLSSGLRINRAGDDAAGLAISEGLRSQIRGLKMATRNSNDAISLIQTAEGAISTYTEICQRIRELAVQAASDVNSDDNRASIQLEINEQLKELDRIATTMEFNGQKLFDGTFVGKRVQAGAQKGETLELNVGDLRTHVIGGVAQNTGDYVNSTALKDGDVIINGIEIGSSEDYTARAKTIAINEAYYDTGVRARVENAQVVGAGPVAAGGAQTLDLSAGDTITINGVKIPTSGTLVVETADASGSLRRAINAESQETGVVASLDSTGALVLTSTGDEPFTYSMDSATAVAAANLPGVASTDYDVNGRLRLYSDQPITVADGGGDAQTLLGMEGAYAVDANSSVDSVDVTSFEKAQETLLRIDNALRQINDVRAGLGALTNRLENTISNMMISVENLSASDSRIRDADFAAETAAMTRAQILQQSGVAVLAQANVMPQAALNLLNG